MTAPPDARALAAALADAGLRAEVDAEGTLAVLRAGPAAFAPLAAQRARVVAMARAHGFTHAALELPVADDAASPPRA